jgi:hypothetical protein
MLPVNIALIDNNAARARIDIRDALDEMTMRAEPAMKDGIASTIGDIVIAARRSRHVDASRFFDRAFHPLKSSRLSTIDHRRAASASSRSSPAQVTSAARAAKRRDALARPFDSASSRDRIIRPGGTLRPG